METITIKDEFIKLGQALKLAGLCESGVDAKFAVQEGHVLVNGVTETQRGKKYPGVGLSLRDHQVPQRKQGPGDDPF